MNLPQYFGLFSTFRYLAALFSLSGAVLFASMFILIAFHAFVAAAAVLALTLLFSQRLRNFTDSKFTKAYSNGQSGGGE
ncbi:hypothetical protein [Variovorax terrae]|uniref:Uncharacterized protein n=1 Tax=Variovorax terrae TaxID=2923278 RepID=A0A9X2AQT1_9BURK|nr:hypothetical protein [Variovorax terrae]MCJ0763536.1 hypothetical protein [Variovorax terrae]